MSNTLDEIDNKMFNLNGLAHIVTRDKIAIQALITEARIDELLTYKSNLPDVDSTEVWLNTRLQQLKEKL